jgi:hypothetical protein
VADHESSNIFPIGNKQGRRAVTPQELSRSGIPKVLLDSLFANRERQERDDTIGHAALPPPVLRGKRGDDLGDGLLLAGVQLAKML